MRRRNPFPWRTHNRFRLLVDSLQFMPAMLKSIDQAKHFILLEQYLAQSGEVFNTFAHHLIRAQARGVEVYILLDDFGSSAVSHEDRRVLLQAGIHLRFYNPFSWRALYRSLRRDHRKLLVVDNHQAFVGGAGISDSYAQNARHELNWHDVMLQIEGENVSDWIQAYSTVWKNNGGKDLALPAFAPVEQGNQPGCIYLSRGLLRNDIIRSTIAQINKSDRRVWLTTPYFVSHRKLRRVLRQAAHRQVDVRILLPGPISDHPWISNAGRRYYRRLLQAGVKIFEYQPRFIHAKLILCDDWASIGSSNLDRWNHRWNLDANQAVFDSGFSREVAEMFENDFMLSRMISLADWEQRPRWQRLRESTSGLLVRALQWFNYIISRHHRD